MKRTRYQVVVIKDEGNVRVTGRTNNELEARGMALEDAAELRNNHEPFRCVYAYDKWERKNVAFHEGNEKGRSTMRYAITLIGLYDKGEELLGERNEKHEALDFGMDEYNKMKKQGKVFARVQVWDRVARERVGAFWLV